MPEKIASKAAVQQSPQLHNINTTQAITDDPIVTKKQASKCLNISERKIDYERAAGNLPYMKFGTQVRFRKSALDAWAKKHEVN